MTASRRLVLLVALAGVILLLVVLASGVHNLKLLPGKPIPNPLASVQRAPAGEPVTGPRQGPTAVWFVILRVWLVLSFLGVVIMAIVSERFRRRLLVLAILAAALVFIFSRMPLPQIGLPAQSQPQAPTSPAPGTAGPERPEIPEVHAPNWGAILVGLAAAVLSSGLVLLFFLKVYPRLRRARGRGEGVLDELGQRANEAARRIRAGEDPREAILRCYKEMSEILSRRRRVVNYAHLTPREFTARLREAGMTDEHVDRLTAIFEEVRYGGRSGEPFAREAVVCLEAVRHAYAGGGAA